MTACGFDKPLREDFWHQGALVEEEIERTVIAVGMASSDEDEGDDTNAVMANGDDSMKHMAFWEVTGIKWHSW